MLREATEDGLPVGAVLAKFGTITQSAHEIHVRASLISKANLMKEGGVTISCFNLTQHLGTCSKMFLNLPMGEDHEERYATLMDARIVDMCRPGVQLSQVSYFDLIINVESHLDDDDGWVEIKVKRETSSNMNDLEKRIVAGEIFAANQIKQGNGKWVRITERLIRLAMNCTNGTSHGGLFTQRTINNKLTRETNGKWIWTLTDNRVYLCRTKTIFAQGQDNHYHEI